MIQLNIRPRRAAWSLIELLVILAIVAILFGMTLAAVQRARETAARAECVNKLKQLALGLHQHHDAHRAFPAGINGPTSLTKFMGWPTRVLPYIDQEALWQKAQIAYRTPLLPQFVSPPHTELFGTIVPAFGCSLADRLKGPWPDSPDLIAFTWYVGVLGENASSRTGILFRDAHVHISEITDGTSSTLIVGERPPSPEGFFGWWYAGAGQGLTGSLDMILGVRDYCETFRLPQCERGPYDYQDGSLEDSCDVAHFWSLHSGGANFAFADGSVRFLRYEANAIMPAVASRAGGEVVSAID